MYSLTIVVVELIMSKQFKIMNKTPTETSTSQIQSSFHPIAIDWNKCVLCQKDSDNELICAVNFKRHDVGAGYRYVFAKLWQFHELGALPFDLDIKYLDDGDGIENTLTDHKALWHKACRDKLSELQLNRAKKRKHRAEIYNVSPVKARRSRNKLGMQHDEHICFFCDGPPGSSGFHMASSLGIDYNVRHCATELQDRQHMSKLAAGDMVAIDAKYHIKCLTQLYRRAAKLHRDTAELALKGIAFAELVAYIEMYRDNMETAPIFNLAHLGKCTQICCMNLV